MKKTAIKAMCAAMAAAMSVAAFASCGKNPAENKFFIGAHGSPDGRHFQLRNFRQAGRRACREGDQRGGRT